MTEAMPNYLSPTPYLPSPQIRYGDFPSCRLVSHPRTSRLAMMSEAIEGVDLDADVRCEVEKHDHAADAIMRSDCPGCGKSRTGGICWDWWRFLGIEQVVCGRCGHVSARDAKCRIVEVLR